MKRGRFYLHTAVNMYVYNCELQKQFRNITEHMEPKQVKVYKNTQYCSYLYGYECV